MCLWYRKSQILLIAIKFLLFSGSLLINVSVDAISECDSNVNCIGFEYKLLYIVRRYQLILFSVDN